MEGQEGTALGGTGTVHAWVVAGSHRSRAGADRLLARAAARLLRVEAGQVVVSREPDGRPAARTADGARAFVSLSYGRKLIAVAASLAGPVGIDIEGGARIGIEGGARIEIEGGARIEIEGGARIDIEAGGAAGSPTRHEQLADRWFDPVEADWLRSRPAADRPTDFLLLWTAKEALGKALGIGLRGAGLGRRVPLPPVADGRFRPAPDGLWLAAPEPGPDQVLAVACGAEATALLVHDGRKEDASGHVVPARSTARSRDSLPVVVRGN